MHQGIKINILILNPIHKHSYIHLVSDIFSMLRSIYSPVTNVPKITDPRKGGEKIKEKKKKFTQAWWNGCVKNETHPIGTYVHNLDQLQKLTSGWDIRITRWLTMAELIYIKLSAYIAYANIK